MLIRGLQGGLESDLFAFVSNGKLSGPCSPGNQVHTGDAEGENPTVRSIPGWMRGFTRLRVYLAFIKNNREL
jgi:hypothetical protein